MPALGSSMFILLIFRGEDERKKEEEKYLCNKFFSILVNFCGWEKSHSQDTTHLKAKAQFYGRFETQIQ